MRQAIKQDMPKSTLVKAEEVLDTINKSLPLPNPNAEGIKETLEEWKGKETKAPPGNASEEKQPATP